MAKILGRLGFRSLSPEDLFNRPGKTARVEIGDGDNFGVGVFGKRTVQRQRPSTGTNHSHSHPLVGTRFLRLTTEPGRTNGRDSGGSSRQESSAIDFRHDLSPWFPFPVNFSTTRRRHTGGL